MATKPTRALFSSAEESRGVRVPIKHLELTPSQRKRAGEIIASSKAARTNAKAERRVSGPKRASA